MFKSIIKEFFIMILMLLTIILILAIWLYDYYPANKTIPIELPEYTLEETAQKELQEKIEETKNIVVTYRIKEEDLASYEKTNEYDRGKVNPFRVSSSNVGDKENGIINNVGK